MSKKIILLIIASILGLFALCLIQAHLIKNTYSLKKEAFIEKAKKTANKIDDYASPIDSIYDKLSEKFIIELDNYSLQFINKKQLIEKLRTITDSLNTRFINEYEKSVQSKKLAYNLKFHKILKDIVMIDSMSRDTIFKENPLKPYKVIGHEFTSNPELYLGGSLWETERSFKKVIYGEEKQIYYKLLFKSENYINIDDWERIVFSEMKGLLLLSFCIFLFVIGVLYFSIKNLISQKKIADIKTDFVNNITHELKTPLATLSLATKLLKKQEIISESETISATVATIERQHQKLQKLVDQVLNNSLGYKEIILQKERVVATKFLTTVLNDFEVSCTENITFKKEINRVEETIYIDAFYIATALTNMLENAVKYGGKHIVVIAKINHHCMEISIQDDGIGISKEHQKIVFEKFFRAENKVVHNVKGLGLGLYYSNQIIKAHNGNIDVSSEKSKGSIFTIQLPLK